MSSLDRRSRFWIAALVFITVVLSAAWWSGAFRDSVDGTPAVLRPEEVQAEEPELSGLVEGNSAVRATAQSPVEADESAVVPDASPTTLRKTATLTVRVERPEGAPSQGIEVRLESTTVNAPPSFDAADTRGLVIRMPCGADGRALFEGLPFGRYRASAADGDGARDVRDLLFIGDAEHSLDLAMPKPEDGLVVLVQDVQGRPVPFGEVEVIGGIRQVGLAGMEGTPSLKSKCDVEGRAVFPGVDLAGAVVYAEVADGRRGWDILRGRDSRGRKRPSGSKLVVTVDAPGALTGKLLGRPEGWAGSSRVMAWAMSRSHPHYESFGRSFECRAEGDSYRIEGLAPGRYSLTFVDSKGLRLEHPAMGRSEYSTPNSIAPIEVDVEAGITTVQHLTVLPGATLSGVVRTSAGPPIEGALVKATYTPMTSNFPDGFVIYGVNVWRLDSDSRSLGNHPLSHWNVRTDAEGRYRFASLPEGKLRVEVIAAGRTYDRREAVELVDGQVQELEHRLGQAGAIEGVEPGGGYLGVRLKGQSVPAHLAILSRAGDFLFPGLAPGDYELLRYHSDQSVTPIMLVEATVKAAETTWVDLREASRPNRYEARLSDPFGPIQGTYFLGYGRSWKKTDAQGRVAFESTFPLGIPIRASVMRGPMKYRVELADLVEDQGVLIGELAFDDETLRVRTLGVDGSASAAKLTVSTYDLDGDAMKSGSTKELDVDSAGLLELSHLVRGRYKALAVFPSGAEVSAEVEIPTLAPLELREYSTGDLSVLVTDSLGKPIEGGSVDVVWWIGEGAAPEDLFTANGGTSMRGARTDAEGRASLKGLPVGDLSIQVSERGSGWLGQGQAVKRSVYLKQGDEAHLAVTVEGK